MFLDDPIRKIDPESFEYSQDDPQLRATYFYQMYQNCGLIDVPHPGALSEDELLGTVERDEYWLQAAAYHAHTALMDALAGLFEVASDKVDAKGEQSE